MEELDIVRVRLDNGRVALGTIVMIYGNGAAYEVEIPTGGGHGWLVTVKREDIIIWH